MNQLKIVCVGLCFGVIQSTFSLAGGWSGSGGDSASSLFRGLCLGIAKAVREMPHKDLPSKNYDLNWGKFEEACLAVVINPAFVKGTSTWDDLRDSDGSPRSIVFNPDTRELAIHGERFSAEVKSNMTGSLVLITHEVVKFMGLNDLKNEVSAQVFLDYNEAFARTVEKISPSIINVPEKIQLALVREQNIATRELRLNQRSIGQVRERILIARELTTYINEQLTDVSKDLEDAVKVGKIWIQDDSRFRETMAKVEFEWRRGMRATLTEYGDALIKVSSKVSFFAVFPSQGLKNAGLLIKTQAVILSGPTVVDKTTEAEWLTLNVVRVSEDLKQLSEQIKSLREKRNNVTNKLIDKEDF